MIQTRLRAAIVAEAPAQMPKVRIPRRAVIGALGLTGVGALALCALPMLMMRPKPAFADVERAMMHVKTVRYHLKQIEAFPAGPPTFTRDAEQIMRFAPAAEASLSTDSDLKDPAHPTEYRSTVVRDRFGRVTYFTPGEFYLLDRTHADLNMQEERRQEQQLRDELLSRISTPPLAGANHAPIMPGVTDAPWTAKRDLLAGKSCVRFDWERRVDTAPLRVRLQVSVWTDPDTRLVVRMEAHNEDLTGARANITIICDQFRYNEPLADDSFHLPLPPQAHISVITHRKASEPQAAVPTADRAAIENLITQSDNAWKNGDQREFAALLDMEYLSRTYATPGERSQFQRQRMQYWEATLQEHHGLWRSWQTEIREINPVSIMSALPDCYAVETFTHVEDEASQRRQSIAHTFYVRNTPNGWRLLDWNPSLFTTNTDQDASNPNQ